MSYGLAKTFSKDPDSFGKGNVSGVAAPEAANNAASTGSMLPMITLGIPGSPTTAILLGGMIIWGLRPGPLLFTEKPDFVWGLIGSMYVANFVTVILNLAPHSGICPGAGHALYHADTDYLCSLFCWRVLDDRQNVRCLADDGAGGRWVSAAQTQLSGGAGRVGHCFGAVGRAIVATVVDLESGRCDDIFRAADFTGLHVDCPGSHHLPGLSRFPQEAGAGKLWG